MYILRFVIFGSAAWCAQLKTDVNRIIDALYGVEGSDESISMWKSAPLMYKLNLIFFNSAHQLKWVGNFTSMVELTAM